MDGRILWKQFGRAVTLRPREAILRILYAHTLFLDSRRVFRSMWLAANVSCFVHYRMGLFLLCLINRHVLLSRPP